MGLLNRALCFSHLVLKVALWDGGRAAPLSDICVVLAAESLFAAVSKEGLV